MNNFSLELGFAFAFLYLRWWQPTWLIGHDTIILLPPAIEMTKSGESYINP